MTYEFSDDLRIWRYARSTNVISILYRRVVWEGMR